MTFRTRAHRLAAFALALPLAVAAPLPGAADEPVLRVGTSGDYPPFSERHAGGLRGFDIAVAERFAAATSRRVEWVPFRWPELMQAMATGRLDVAMSGVTVRPERSVAGRFTVPVVETGAVVLLTEAAWRARVRDPSRAAAELDRPEVTLAVNAGGHLERVARAHFPSASIRAIADNAAVRDALATGDVDGVVTDTLEAPVWRATARGVRLVGPLTRDAKAYWVRADEPALARALDAWLLAAERDGTLAALRAEWLPGGPAPRTATPLAALLAACDERLSLMPAVAAYKRDRGLPVVDPEREARVLEASWEAVAAAAERAGRAPPPRPLVTRFYRAQIAAAVALQERVLAESRAPGAVAAFDLPREIRPALLRIGERMAMLLVQLPASGEAPPADLASRVTAALARHRLPPDRLKAISAALAALAR